MFPSGFLCSKLKFPFQPSHAVNKIVWRSLTSSHCRLLCRTPLEGSETSKSNLPKNTGIVANEINLSRKVDAALSTFLTHLSAVDDVPRLLSLLLARWNKFDAEVVVHVSKRLVSIEDLPQCTETCVLPNGGCEFGIYRPCMEHITIRRFVRSSIHCFNDMGLRELVSLARLYSCLAVEEFFPTVWLALSQSIVCHLQDRPAADCNLLIHLDGSMLLLCADQILQHDCHPKLVLALAKAASASGSPAADCIFAGLKDVAVHTVLPVDAPVAVSILWQLSSSGFQFDQDMLSSIADHCSGLLHTHPVSSLHALSMLYPHQKLCHRDFLEELCEVMLSRLPDLSAGQLSSMLLSLSRVHFLDDAFCRDVAAAFIASVETASCGDIASVVSGLCRFGTTHSLPVYNLVAEIQKRLSTDCSKEDIGVAVTSLERCLQAGLWSDSCHTSLLATILTNTNACESLLLSKCLGVCSGVLERSGYSAATVDCLVAVVGKVRCSVQTLHVSVCVDVLSSLHRVHRLVNTPAISDLLSATVQIVAHSRHALSAMEINVVLDVLAGLPPSDDLGLLDSIMRQVSILGKTMSFSLCMQCCQAFASLRVSDAKLLNILVQPHCDELSKLTYQELFSLTLILSRLNFKPPWLRRKLRDRAGTLPVLKLDLHQLFLYESLAVLDGVEPAQVALVLKNVDELVSRLSEAQLLPVSQVLLRLYTAINAHRASPGHVRQRVLRSAVPRRGSAASEVLSSVHSAVLQAVAPSCDVGRAVSSAMVYPGVLVAAAVLLDRKGAVKDWRDDFFRTSDDIEEDLSLQGVRFVDSKKLQSNGLIPVGFVVRPKAACLRNNPAAACDRAGFELELASRNRWQCVIVTEEDWNSISSPAGQVEVIQRKLREVRVRLIELPDILHSQ